MVEQQNERLQAIEQALGLQRGARQQAASDSLAAGGAELLGSRVSNQCSGNSNGCQIIIKAPNPAGASES